MLYYFFLRRILIFRMQRWLDSARSLHALGGLNRAIETSILFKLTCSTQNREHVKMSSHMSGSGLSYSEDIRLG